MENRKEPDSRGEPQIYSLGRVSKGDCISEASDFINIHESSEGEEGIWKPFRGHIYFYSLKKYNIGPSAIVMSVRVNRRVHMEICHITETVRLVSIPSLFRGYKDGYML